jgi:GNAT superfamily N-acetyltransferase
MLAIGYMLGFSTYSTWKGRCFYLDDLYIRESYRKLGIGLECIRVIVDTAREMKCKRVQWQALDW